MRFVAAAFLCGVIALQCAQALPDFGWGLRGIVLLVATCLLRDRPIARALVVLAAAIACGYGYGAWRAQLRLADALPFAREGVDIELVGIVSGLPQLQESGTRFAFEVLRGAGVPQDISLAWYHDRRTQAVPKVAACERWRFTVRLKRPRGLANPHAFDFEPWALERGIRATGYVRAKAGAERVTARVDGWPYTLHRWRGEVRDAMRSHLGDARLAGVLVALAIGDQDSIAADDWEVFWRTGVGHLMSISR